MIHILDARNGARLDTLYTQNLSLMLTNTATDRLYLASDDGLIQCLREIEQIRPLPHNIPAAKAAKPTTEQKPMAKKAAEKKEAGEAKPARKPRAKKGEAEEQ